MFDLALDARNATRFDRRESRVTLGYGCIAGTLAVVLGVLILVGRISGTELEGVAAVFGGLALVAGLGVYVMLFLGRNEIVLLAVASNGFVLTRTKGRAESYAWSDPRLAIELCRMEVSGDDVVPYEEPRARQPQWIDVRKGGRRRLVARTTLPVEAYEALRASAGRSLANVQTERVAFYWWQAPGKDPDLGEIRFRAGAALRPGEAMNGEITRVRGPGIASR